MIDKDEMMGFLWRGTPPDDLETRHVDVQVSADKRTAYLEGAWDAVLPGGIDLMFEAIVVEGTAPLHVFYRIGSLLTGESWKEAWGDYNPHHPVIRRIEERWGSTPWHSDYVWEKALAICRGLD